MDTKNDWLIDRLRNLATDSANGEPIDFALEASEIRSTLRTERKPQ